MLSSPPLLIGAPLRCVPAYGSKEIVSWLLLRHDFGGLALPLRGIATT
jgi:hypothetical protein